MRSQRPHAAATGMTCGAELQLEAWLCIAETVSAVVADYVTHAAVLFYSKPSNKPYSHLISNSN